MENLKPRQIQEDFVTPLINLVGELNSDIQMLESLVKEGINPKGYVPLNIATAKKGLGAIKKLRRELRDKLEGMKDGTFLWRSMNWRNESRKEGRKRSNTHVKYVLTCVTYALQLNL